jgi:hypothetical protein
VIIVVNKKFPGILPTSYKRSSRTLGEQGWAYAALGCGGRNRGVMAALSIPQGVLSSNHSQGCLVVSGNNHLSHGRWQSIKKHCEKKMIVWADTVRKMLLELPHENAGLEACISMGSQSSSK